MKRLFVLPVVFLIVVSAFALGASMVTAAAGPAIEIVSPQANQTLRNQTPTIAASFSSPVGIDPGSVKIAVDGLDVTQFDQTHITPVGMNYTPPNILKLANGNHTVFVGVADLKGGNASITWNFTIDTSMREPGTGGINWMNYIALSLWGVGLGVLGFAAYILYLKWTRKFTFRKYFARHPNAKRSMSIFVPGFAAVVTALFGLSYAETSRNASPYAVEYVSILCLFIGLGSATFSAQIEKRVKFRQEKAFSQFLFELAEAMRGGLDPGKAIVELAKTDTSAMKKTLKAASENIRIGRPFEDVMAAMVEPMNSPLISRYASLIGEASTIGGETSQVIFRAAKDMDDLIKVEIDRRRQLTAQTTTIYIAFGVLLVIIYQLVSIYPSLSSMNINLGGGLQSGNTTPVARMSIFTLKQRFFDLMLVNSLGTGMLMGLIVDGKVKYGLVHSMAMIAASTLFFIVLVF